MNITVVGAGNIGLALTASISAKDKYKVCLYTTNPLLKRNSILLRVNEENREEYVSNFNTTSNPTEAFSNADIILCTYPAFLKKRFIDENQKYIKNNAILCFIPGYGGAEYACQKLIQNGTTISGLQRVPFVARANSTEKGFVANILSKKKELYVAAIPHKNTEYIATLLENIFDIPCKALNEYLAVTLAPSNPLLHIVGLYNVFNDYTIGKIYENEMHFYHEWNDNASEILLAYDQELQNICNALQPLNLHEVVSLSKYYEASTPQMMTNKLKSIPAFEEVMVPLTKTMQGYVPDFESRMFTEDFPYGVCVIKDFSLMTGVKTPMVDMLLDFYYKVSGYKYFDENGFHAKDYIHTGAPGNFGLFSKEEIAKFYHRN